MKSQSSLYNFSFLSTPPPPPLKKQTKNVLYHKCSNKKKLNNRDGIVLLGSGDVDQDVVLVSKSISSCTHRSKHTLQSTDLLRLFSPVPEMTGTRPLLLPHALPQPPTE